MLVVFTLYKLNSISFWYFFFANLLIRNSCDNSHCTRASSWGSSVDSTLISLMGVEIMGKERHRLPENKISPMSLCRAATIHEDTVALWEVQVRQNFFHTKWLLRAALCDLMNRKNIVSVIIKIVFCVVFFLDKIFIS